jgi:hypothetical protein
MIRIYDNIPGWTPSSSYSIVKFFGGMSQTTTIIGTTIALAFLVLIASLITFY